MHILPFPLKSPLFFPHINKTNQPSNLNLSSNASEAHLVLKNSLFRLNQIIFQQNQQKTFLYIHFSHGVA